MQALQTGWDDDDMVRAAAWAQLLRQHGAWLSLHCGCEAMAWQGLSAALSELEKQASDLQADTGPACRAEGGVADRRDQQTGAKRRRV